jgi:hypothetical protein
MPHLKIDTLPQPMSEDQQNDFFDRLKTLDLVVKLGWALLAGAFGLGIWVTSIQLEVSNNTRGANSHETRVRDLELKESVNSERLNTALKILERIDRKINP